MVIVYTKKELLEALKRKEKVIKCEGQAKKFAWNNIAKRSGFQFNNGNYLAGAIQMGPVVQEILKQIIMFIIDIVGQKILEYLKEYVMNYKNNPNPGAAAKFLWMSKPLPDELILTKR